MSTEFLLRPAVSPLNINLELEVLDYGVYRWSRESMAVLRDIAVLAKYSCCCCDLSLESLMRGPVVTDYSSSAFVLIYFLPILDRSRLVRLA